MALNMKKYKILCKDSHDYDVEIGIIDNHKVIKIYNSNDVNWNIPYRGKYIIGLEDTGDEVKLDYKVNKIIQYDQIMLLKFLLIINDSVDFKGEFKHQLPEYKIVEEKTLLTLI